MTVASNATARTLVVAVNFTHGCDAVVTLNYAARPDGIGSIRVLANGAWRWRDDDPTATWPEALRDLVAEGVTAIVLQRAGIAAREGAGE